MQIPLTCLATYHVQLLLQFNNSNEIFQFSAETLDEFTSKLLRISATGVQSPVHAHEKLRATNTL